MDRARGTWLATSAFWGACAALLLGAPLRAQATGQASIVANASVLSLAPLTATPVADLAFGPVLAGTSSAPVNLASDAGRFDVTGEPGAAIALTFTLPANLTGPGGTVPVSFAATDGLWWSPFPAAFTAFDPNAPFAVLLDGAGTVTIGIAGTVSPPIGTIPGLYTGTITLSVEYL